MSARVRERVRERVRARGRASLALAVCGMAGALALAGCSTQVSASVVDRTPQTSAPGTAQAATPGASGSPASGLPSWASSLGPGVTVTMPQQMSPGHSSPGAAVEFEIAELFNGTENNTVCQSLMPAARGQCRADIAAARGTSLEITGDASLGYIAVSGTRALVGTTGTRFCLPGSSINCFGNDDPAAVFTSGKAFPALWADAVAAGSDRPNRYSLTPCVQVNGQWYLYALP